MASLTLPEGAIAYRTPGSDEDLISDRIAHFEFDLLSRSHRPLGLLSGVEPSGGLEWNANAAIKGGGRISVRDLGQNVDWSTVRIRPRYVMASGRQWPLSIWLPSTPKSRWSARGRTWQIELFDRAVVLEQDKLDAAYALPAGTNITTAVRTIIQSAGEDAGSITDSTETLPNPRVWAAGTTKLKIVNDLLDAGGFFSLKVDMNGAFRAEPYMRPATRATRWRMIDGPTSIFSPDFTAEEDFFDVPNKVNLTGRGTATTEALTGIATNTNATSRFSYAARGNRWIVHTDTVDATSQAAIDALATRTLIAMTAVTGSVDIEHAPIPIEASDVMEFRRVPAGINARHVVEKTSIEFNPTKLAASTLRQVVDL